MSKPSDDDPFKDSVMTFGEHLEELRGCLWRAVLGLAVGAAFGFFFADAVVRFISSPLENALKVYYTDAAEAELRKINPNATEHDLDRVTKQGMVFERAYVDPQQLANLLQKSPPDLTAPAASAGT